MEVIMSTAWRNVQATAFIAAEFRAEENGKPHPLYSDPVVHAFLDEESKKAAAQISASFMPLRQSVWLRTRFFDDRLGCQIRKGCQQVVILGAGLDTRAQRKQAPGVKFYEIDNGDLLAFKKTKLEERHAPLHACYIAGDYVSQRVSTLLKENGFDSLLPTHFIWEGNTMYLGEEAAHQVIRDISRTVESFSLSFDFLSDDVIANSTGESEITSMAERFAAMGAPWTYGIGDLDGFGSRVGPNVLERFTIGDLYRSYKSEEPPGSKIYDHYSVCTLQSFGAQS
jgi:methyltransferase (TIGR00027 family)